MVNPFLTLAWFCTFDVVVIQGRIFLISKWISEIPLSSVVLYIFTFSVKHLNWKHVFKGRSLKLVLVIVVQSLSPTLHDDPMNCSMPGFPVLYYLLEFVQTQVHWVSDAIQPSHPVSPPSPPALKVNTVYRNSIFLQLFYMSKVILK